MTLKQLKKFNEVQVERFEKKEISVLEYYNSRMFVLITLSKGTLDPEEDEEDETE